MKRILIIAAALLVAIVLSPQRMAISQDVMIPNFWDQNVRYAKPEISNLPRLRYMTTTDFPPFNFIDRKRRLSGFHVDLARAICDELELLNRCEIQALPWEELHPALEKGDAEALLAGHLVSNETREVYNFSNVYMRIPARFVTRQKDGLKAPAFQALFRKKTAVVGGSAHAKYFKDVFATRQVVEFSSRETALNALKQGEVDAVFSDALSLSFWLSSQDEGDCCRFLDEAFVSETYFGPGLAIALPKSRPELVPVMNYALSELNRNGTFAELYLRYFPVGLF